MLSVMNTQPVMRLMVRSFEYWFNSYRTLAANWCWFFWFSLSSLILYQNSLVLSTTVTLWFSWYSYSGKFHLTCWSLQTSSYMLISYIYVLTGRINCLWHDSWTLEINVLEIPFRLIRNKLSSLHNFSDWLITTKMFDKLTHGPIRWRSAKWVSNIRLLLILYSSRLLLQVFDIWNFLNSRWCAVLTLFEIAAFFWSSRILLYQLSTTVLVSDKT